MFDIWAFLLQTLTASGVAVLLLVIKGLFKDKLPPKWHFLVWSTLGLMILLPAGLFGRYTLFRWRLVIEIIKAWFGDYSFTRVLFPIPILNAVPGIFLEWVFAIYTLGVVVFAVKYLVSYARLRHVLSKGRVPHDETMTRIRQIAAEHGIKPCKVIEVQGLPGAFVCGVLRPILAIPAEGGLDDKVILHELFHLKHRDTFWSVVICLLRCLHWCNPLLIYCANRAINDMESRCDQYVLESLEGEDRRDYGRILLSMTNNRFAKTAGSTCINNGGKNIRDRIEAIARFKKYPAGMGLVSICVIIVLVLSLAVGVQASSVYYNSTSSVQIALASARSAPCTTPAGAFDAYAKAMLSQNEVYRAMCAPASMQADIAASAQEYNIYPDCALDVWPDSYGGYYIYNLKQSEKNVYEGLLVIKVGYLPEDQVEEDEEAINMYLAIRNVRVQKEGGRWVAISLDEFRYMSVYDRSLEWGCSELPGFIYSGTADNIRVDDKIQTIHVVDSQVNIESPFMFFGDSTYFDTTPKPNADFSTMYRVHESSVTHLGTEEDRNAIKQIGVSVAPVFSGGKRPENLTPATGYGNWGGTSSNGEAWRTESTEPGWGPTISLSGGGSTYNPTRKIELPEYCAADLYINSELTAQIDLYLQEELLA